MPLRVLHVFILSNSTVLLVICNLSWGQQATGTITGTITDPQNAVVPGATVEIRNVATNAAFETKSNDAGFYNAPNLPVGEYTVSASANGFKRAVRTGVGLQVGQNAQINITLDVGQVAETVEVQAEAPLVDTGSATLGVVIENRRVRDLPLNGRNALALTLLNSGVISNAGPTNSGFGDRGVQISSLSINGSPNSMNAQMLDGNNNVLSYVGEVGVPPAVDAVEEFKVQSGTMSSEYGFTAGGAINLVTKSGTNQFHGTLYEFLRNDKLDARNTFATRKLPLRYNQFGGSLGGPDHQESDLRLHQPRRVSPAPEHAAHLDCAAGRVAAGRLQQFPHRPGTTDPDLRSQDDTAESEWPGTGPRPVSRQSSSRRHASTRSRAKILDFWPLPNRTPINAFTQSQNFEDQRSDQDELDAIEFPRRSSVHRSQLDLLPLHARQASERPAIRSSPIPQSGRTAWTIRSIATSMISDTHTFSPSLLNNLRVGVMRQAFDFAAINAGKDWPTNSACRRSSRDDQFPQIDFGYGTIGGQAYGTRGSLNWDIQETLTWLVGSHTLKFGYNHRILQGSNRQGAALSGNYTFGGLTANPQATAGTGSNLAQFLLGEVGSGSIDRILGNSWHGIAASAFVQDDWRVSSPADPQSRPAIRLSAEALRA